MMPQSFPGLVNQDLINPNSGGAWIAVCEIAVPGYATQQLARNTEDVAYGGKNYRKHNLDIGDEIFTGDGSVPRVVLRVFQDIDGTIEQIINETEGAYGGSVCLIKVGEKFLDAPIPALEADWDILTAESDCDWVTFILGIPNPLTTRVPKTRYSSSACPWARTSRFKGIECGYAGADASCTGTFFDCYGKGNATRWGADLGLDSNAVKV
jgi:phage-related protein